MLIGEVVEVVLLLGKEVNSFSDTNYQHVTLVTGGNNDNNIHESMFSIWTT
jgi:hypothetical protein